MKTKEPRHHYLDVYHTNLHVAVTPSELKTLLNTFKHFENPLANDHPPAAATNSFIGMTDGAESYHVIFWLDKKMWQRGGSNFAILANICAHEAIHGAGKIWNHINAEMNNDTLHDDEPFAYLIGWLTEFLFESITEHDKYKE